MYWKCGLTSCSSGRFNLTVLHHIPEVIDFPFKDEEVLDLLLYAGLCEEGQFIFDMVEMFVNCSRIDDHIIYAD